MSERINIIVKFWVEILIGVLILFNADDIRWFLLYLLVLLLITLTLYVEYIRKLIRSFQVFNELKLIAIMRKLKVSADEMDIVFEDEKKNMGQKWNEIEKEFNELTNG